MAKSGSADGEGGRAGSDSSAVALALGAVVGSLPVGEVRPGQLQMAEAVAATFAEETGVLAVAAGTGTGKSFAYLVPAALSGKRVVVATATKALQDQLADKDLPLVATALEAGGRGRSATTSPTRRGTLAWAVLKGRSNYLCRQKLAEMEEFGQQEQLEAQPAAPVRSGAAGVVTSTTTARARRPSKAATIGEQVARLVQWSHTTRSGDRAELDFEPEPRAWSAVSVTADECPGASRCPMGAECFTEHARGRAQRADVVVVNLHLLGADLRSGGLVLPEHDALVVDEAHELEDVLAASLGVEVSPGRMRALAAAARASANGDTAVDDVLAVATRFEAALGSEERSLPPGLGPDVGPAARLAVSRLMRLESELRRATEADKEKEKKGKSADRALRSLLGVERCRSELERCLEAGDDNSEVVWVAGGDRPTLRSAPLDVSRTLAAEVFANLPVVLTSATLAPGLPARLGATRTEEPITVEERDVGSPFDYQNNGLIYCAVNLPDRRSAAAEAAMADEIEHLVTAAGGRTLALFTSRRAMEQAAAALKARIHWPIHTQGDAPKAALLRAFSEEEESCLFATMGFWQGVDVPGPTLSLVVIDRLPFPRPDDPLMSARRKVAGAEGFRAVDLPRAATLLAQGAGRLIRTASDRGVVAVLDPRLARATYSGYLVRALPKMRRTRERDEAVAFLTELRELGGLSTPAARSAPAGAATTSRP